MAVYSLELYQAQIILTVPDMSPSNYDVDVSDILSLDDTNSIASNFGYPMLDTLEIGWPDIDGWDPVWEFYRTNSDTLTLTPDMSPQWSPAAFVVEMLRLSPSLSPVCSYGLSITETAEITDALGAIIALLMSEGVTLTEAWTVVQGVLMTDTLFLKPRGAQQMAYAPAIAEQIIFSPALLAFYLLSYNDTLELSPAWVASAVRNVGLEDEVDISESLACTLTWNVVYDECVELEDTEDVGAIYGWAFKDCLRLGIMFADPGGGVTTWAMNARTGAVTEYTNYAFNSFARMGDKYLGADSTGLYELDGENDSGTPVIARLAGGLLQLSGSRFTSFKAAYLGLRGGGPLFLKLITGDDKVYIYRVMAHSLRTVRVDLGKGLRSRYFRWEVETVGQDFDLDSLEFLPISSTRRI